MPAPAPAPAGEVGVAFADEMPCFRFLQAARACSDLLLVAQHEDSSRMHNYKTLASTG